MSSKSYQIKRAKLMLGSFNEQEIRNLLLKGKLLSTDEVLNDVGAWEVLQAFVGKLPPPLPSKKLTHVGASLTSAAPRATPAIKPKVSYLKLWLKTTLWIYGIGVLFGFLAAGAYGFGWCLGAGLILAPIKGAFWAWIIWLFKK